LNALIELGADTKATIYKDGAAEKKGQVIGHEKDIQDHRRFENSGLNARTAYHLVEKSSGSDAYYLHVC
jgi:hypothetical protein